MIQVNITEQMVDAQPQEIITNDNLNARVDAQVYFKVYAHAEISKQRKRQNKYGPAYNVEQRNPELGHGDR